MNRKISTLAEPFAEAGTKGQGRGGFTLIELLVATAILVVLVVLVAQMVRSVASGTAASTHHIDADDEIRTVFDRMGEDFATMIQRPDVNPLWVPATGNDAFYFLSQAPASFTNTGGTSTNSQIALIGYSIGTNGLQRLGQGLSWDDPLLQFTGGAVSTNGINTNDIVAIAPSVFRMEYALLMKPGTYVTVTVSSGTTNTYTNIIGTNVFVQTNFPGYGMKDVAGIVVALAILDQNSQKILTPGAISNTTLITVFPDASLTTVSPGTSTNNGVGAYGIPMTTWTTANLSPSVSVVIPQAAARSQIRVYQRYFPLNH